MKNFYLFIIFLLTSCFLLFASPSVEDIQSLSLKDMKKIESWLKDKNTSPRFRVMILEKINILLLENKNNLLEYGNTLLDLFSYLFKENIGQGSSYSLVLRKKTCLMLGYFNSTEHKSNAYELLKTEIELDSDGDVASACIRSLGEYVEKKDESVKFINKLLDSSLKKKKITDEDIEVAQTCLELYGKFKMKQSILTLMKILDSKYPTEIKNLSKQILESIPQ
jgi:hypothetical protein